ncbi:MAG: ABC transporter permease subunit [Actinomycetota bacterium]|nr:ABC transporter permease subunit [Actinomycetota bacterium]
MPTDLREASAALGARTSRTILTVVIPAALPGLVSGALLAVARAAGETAPLLFTIGTVTSANPRLLEGTNTALSAQIFVNARQPFDAAVDRAWGAALTLIVLVFVLTAIRGEPDGVRPSPSRPRWGRDPRTRRPSHAHPTRPHPRSSRGGS